MSQQKPAIIERAYQDAETWLIDLAERIDQPLDLHNAYHALRAVLHTMRDNLLPDEAMDVSSQLPTLIRGIYFEGYRLPDKPEPHRSRKQFLEAVEAQLENEDARELDAEKCARAVFALLQQRLDPGQAAQARDMLHGDVQALWAD
jgi:uncharacterized protein (DUF2267 family)